MLSAIADTAATAPNERLLMALPSVCNKNETKLEQYRYRQENRPRTSMSIHCRTLPVQSGLHARYAASMKQIVVTNA
jgi:hypothetical protein